MAFAPVVSKPLLRKQHEGTVRARCLLQTITRRNCRGDVLADRAQRSAWANGVWIACAPLAAQRALPLSLALVWRRVICRAVFELPPVGIKADP